MIRYPNMPSEMTSRDLIDVFGGYNHNLRIGENEFFDMKNLSSSKYPLLSTREKRGSVPSNMVGSHLVNLSYAGIRYMDGLYYIVKTGTNHYYLYEYLKGAQQPSAIDNWYNDTDGIRQLIPMGAYLVILPDKKYINLKEPERELKPIEKVWTQGADMTIQPCLEDGTVLSIDYVGDKAPDNPADNYVWLDTSVSPASLKRYYAANSMWQSFVSNYVKLTCTGISTGFEVGDGVEIKNISDAKLSDLNGTSIIKAKGTNYIVITGIIDAVNDDTILTARETFILDSNANASAYFLCGENIQRNIFKDKQIKIGDKAPIFCSANNAGQDETAYIWEVVDEMSPFIKTLTVSSMNQKGTKIYISQVYTPIEGVDEESDYYVPASGGKALLDEELFTALIDKSIRFGNTGMVAAIEGGGVEAATQTTGPKWYITVDRSVSVEADAVIYPVEQVSRTDKYMTGLFFSNASGTVITVGEKACPSLETQYSQVYVANSTTNVTVSRTMPKMDFVFESKNRLWGCRYGLNNAEEFVNEIYSSKLGDFKNWNCFEGLSTDSFAASCGTEGNWTGAINYRGYPTFFKEHHIHTVYGSYPSQFQINNTYARGVQSGSSDSVAIVNEVLYYKSIDGVCAYSGGLPSDISSQLGGIMYKEAKGCSFRGKYYLCMKDTSNNPVLFVYDTTKGLWHKEDDLFVEQFCAVDDDIFYLLPNGSTGAMFGTGGKDPAPVKWFAETGLFGLSLPDKKYVSRLNLRLSLSIGSWVTVFIQYDSNGIWNQLCRIQGINTKPFSIPIRPRRCDHFRLKLEGVGDVKVYSVSKTIEQGSDI